MRYLCKEDFNRWVDNTDRIFREGVWYEGHTKGDVIHMIYEDYSVTGMSAWSFHKETLRDFFCTVDEIRELEIDKILKDG
jgi:hypothetical protein